MSNKVLKIYRTANTAYTVLQRIVHPKMARVLLQVTYDCNQKCKTCGIWTVNKDNPSLRDKEMTLEEIQKFSEANKDLILAFPTGGEPFLRKDFKYIAESLLNIPSLRSLSITSNGTVPLKIGDDLSYVLRHTKNRLATVAVQISFEGPEEVHDEIAGLPGSYQKAKKSLELIQSMSKEFHQLRSQVSYTFSRFNRGQLRSCLDGLNGLCPPINHIGIGIAFNARYYFLNEDEVVAPEPNDFLEEINWLRRQYSWKHLFDPIGLISTRSMLKRVAEGTTSRIGCPAAQFTCVVDPYWNVHPCLYLAGLTLGNLKDYNYNIQTLIDETEKTWKPAITRCFANGGCKSTCELHTTALFRPWKILF